MEGVDQRNLVHRGERRDALAVVAGGTRRSRDDRSSRVLAELSSASSSTSVRSVVSATAHGERGEASGGRPAHDQGHRRSRGHRRRRVVRVSDGAHAVHVLPHDAIPCGGSGLALRHLVCGGPVGSFGPERDARSVDVDRQASLVLRTVNLLR